jgi:naphthalene 1,2-dioxygenase system ferredoxin subunit
MSEDWKDVAARDLVPEGDVVAVIVDGNDIALYDVEGQIYATDNRCTHGAGRMSESFLEGNEIECPMHQGRFNVCTGAALCAPLTQDLRIYLVRIHDGRILLNLG